MKSMKKPAPGKPRKPTKGTYSVGFGAVKGMKMAKAKPNFKRNAAMDDNDGDDNCNPGVAAMMKSFKAE